MALISCPECGKEISDTSSKCIHCGYEIKNNTQKKCPECNEEIMGTEIICPNCGYKLKEKKNMRIIFIAACILVVIATAVLIFLGSFLSSTERIIKKSIDVLELEDEEIMSCMIFDLDDEIEGEYYVYFETDRTVYMTHVVDGIVESYADWRQAKEEGMLNGSKAASELLFIQYRGMDQWEVIDHKIIKKLQ